MVTASRGGKYGPWLLLDPMEIPPLPLYELPTGDPPEPPPQASPSVTFDSWASRVLATFACVCLKTRVLAVSRPGRRANVQRSLRGIDVPRCQILLPSLHQYLEKGLLPGVQCLAAHRQCLFPAPSPLVILEEFLVCVDLKFSMFLPPMEVKADWGSRVWTHSDSSSVHPLGH